jgi:hypothetical protein
MRDYKSEFNQCWDRFKVNVKAKLMNRSEEAPLTVAGANLALKDAVTGWLDEFDILGSLLVKVKRDQPDTAKEIERILRFELVFKEESREKSITDLAAYAVPIAGAVAGGGISMIRKANFLVKVASIVLPAAVLTPVMKQVKQNKEQEIDKKLINQYVLQLEGFKEKILKLL